MTSENKANPLYFKQISTLRTAGTSRKECTSLAISHKYGIVALSIGGCLHLTHIDHVLSFSGGLNDIDDIFKTKVPSSVLTSTEDILAVGVQDTTFLFSFPELVSDTPRPAATIKVKGQVLQIAFNPTDSTMIAILSNDGSVRLSKIGPQGSQTFGFNDNQVTCICFSPKGKQLCVGHQNGEFSQLKLDLTVAKKFAGPSATPVSLIWVSTTQFVALFRDGNNEDVFVGQIDLQKGAPPTILHLGDIFVSDIVNEKSQCYFSQLNPETIICSSSTSSEIVALTKSPNSSSWTVADIDDPRRAALPIDNYSSGGVLYYNYPNAVVFNESEVYGQMPVYLVFSQWGIISTFSVVNKDGLGEGAKFSRSQQLNWAATGALLEPVQQQPPVSVAPAALGQSNVPVQPATNIFQQQLGKPANMFGSIQQTGAAPPQVSFSLPFSTPTTPFVFTIPSSTPAKATSAPAPPMPQLSPITPPPTDDQQKEVDPASSISLAQSEVVRDPATSRLRKQSKVLKLPTEEEIEKMKAQVQPSDSCSEALIRQFEDLQIRLNNFKELKESFAKNYNQKLTTLSRQIEGDSSKLNKMEDFNRKIENTCNVQANEVSVLRDKSLLHYSQLYYAKSLEERNKDPKYIEILKSQPMDPGTLKSMKDIESRAGHIRNQIQECRRYNYFAKCPPLSAPETREYIQKTLATHAAIIKRVASEHRKLKHLFAPDAGKELDQLSFSLMKKASLKDANQDFELDRESYEKLKDFSRTKSVIKLKNGKNSSPAAYFYPAETNSELGSKPVTSADLLREFQEIDKIVDDKNENGANLVPLNHETDNIKPACGDESLLTTNSESPKPPTNNSTSKQVSSRVSTSLFLVGSDSSTLEQPIASSLSLLGLGQPVTATTSTASIFNKPAASVSIFGQPTVSTPQSIFGQPTVSTPQSIFGQPTVSTATQSIFGQPSASTTQSIFGQPVVSSTIQSILGQPSASTTQSIFGQPAVSTTTQSIFGQPAVSTTTQSIFGQPAVSTTTQSIFGQPAVSTTTQSIFGQPAVSTTTQSIFGQPAVSTTQSILGQPTTTTTTQSIYGQPATSTTTQSMFGQPATSTTPSIFGQPAVSSTTQSIFGQPAVSSTTQSILGQPAASPTTQPIIGPSAALPITQPILEQPAASSTTPSIFGQPASSPTTQSILGQPATSTTTQSIFGQPATSTTTQSIFGQPTSLTTTQPIFGQPATSTITQSIFGQPAASPTRQSIFGQPAASPTAQSIFGQPAASPTTQSTFGQPATSTTQSIFGQPSSLTTTQSMFGQPAVTTTQSVFGQPSVSTTQSIFGQHTSLTTTQSIFGQPAASPTTQYIFGQPAASSTAQSIFGQPAASPTRQSIFGQPAASTTAQPIFGQPATSPTTQSIFGQSTASSTTQSIFGQPAASSTTQSIFGQPTPSTTQSIFGQPAVSSTTQSIFGQRAASPITQSIFGQPAASSTTQSIFGQPAASPAAQSIFGQPAASPTTPSIFGQPAVSSTAQSIFGQPAATPTGQSIFGQPAASPTRQSVFGQPAASPTAQSIFGQSAASPTTQSVFGQPATSTATQSIFGQPAASPTTHSIFGQHAPSQTVFGAAPVFGSTPTFGSTPFGSSGSSTFGSSSGGWSGAGSIFGGSTIQQGTVSFGQLAQQSTGTGPGTGASPFQSSSFGFGQQQQQQQPQQQSSSFGGTSFSAWR